MLKVPDSLVTDEDKVIRATLVNYLNESYYYNEVFYNLLFRYPVNLDDKMYSETINFR